MQTTAQRNCSNLYEKLSDLSRPITLKFHEDSFCAYNCDKPDLEVQVTKDELLTLYKEMLTVCRMEMAADALYKAKFIRGFYHLAIGQVRFPGRLMQHVDPTGQLTATVLDNTLLSWAPQSPMDSFISHLAALLAVYGLEPQASIPILPYDGSAQSRFHWARHPSLRPTPYNSVSLSSFSVF